MDLLEKICEKLGVRVNEEWKGNDGKTYVIDEVGQLHYYDKDNKARGYVNVSDKIPKLIIGELKPKWKPKYGDIYYIPNISANRNFRFRVQIFDSTDLDNWYLDRGLIFKTKEEAIEWTDIVMGLGKEEC